MSDDAGDLLVGKLAIEAFLIHLGMPRMDVYYLKRTGWPIGNTGGTTGGHAGKLIASKRRLVAHTQKLAAGAALGKNERLTE